MTDENVDLLNINKPINKRRRVTFIAKRTKTFN